MNLIFHIVVLSVICYAYGSIYKADSCKTPTGYDGECIYYDKCPSIVRHVRVTKDRSFLRRSKCGSNKNYFCCQVRGEPECYTPDGREGECLDFNTHKDKFKDYSNKFVVDSRCSTPGRVCYSSAPLITSPDCSTGFPSSDVNSSCCGVDANVSDKIFDNETACQQNPGEWTVLVPTYLSNSTTEDFTQLRARMEIAMLIHKEDTDVQLQQLTGRISEVKSQNRAISDANSNFEKTMDDIISMYEELETKLDKMRLEHQEILNAINSLEKLLEEEFRKQTGLAVVIKPVPFQRNENIIGIVNKIDYYLGGVLQPEKIIKAYRDGTYGKYSITVEYQTTYQRGQLLKEFKKYTNDNRGSKITPKMLGINNNTRPIYITKPLTPKTQKLLKEANSLQKHYGFEYLWMVGDKIFIRETKESGAIEITSHAQIESLRVKQAARNVGL